MDTVNAKEPAILVDWSELQGWEDVYGEWLKKRQKNIKVVFLVTDPKNNDFDYGESGIEPDVVLRNSVKAPMPDLLFKTTAIVTIQESSNLVPVIGVDDSGAVRKMYDEAGVVVTLDSYDLMNL